MIDPSVISKDIAPQLLRRYLIGRGWIPSSSGRKFELFTLPGEGDESSVEIVLPLVSDSRAFRRGVDDALRTLSQLQAKPIEEVASDVRAVASDIIRNVIPDHYVHQDSIELRVARAFMKHFREFLATAASAELRPDLPFHARILKDGKRYADNCRFGHTFRGSFGFTIESPVGLNDEPDVVDGVSPAPFPRRVVERIARGLEAVNKAAQTENPSIITSHFATGMSANMCSSLVRLIQETGIPQQSIVIRFSPEWTPPEGLGIEPRLPVMLRHVPVLEEAAAELRKKDDEAPTLVVGRIVALETEGRPNLLEDTSAREVVISWETPSPIRVHVSLAPPDYLTALEAHRKGALVSVRGVIERTTRKHTLKSPESFTVLPIEFS